MKRSQIPTILLALTAIILITSAWFVMQFVKSGLRNTPSLSSPPASSEMQAVDENEYQFSIPKSWRVEGNRGSGAAVYSDDATPCKMELSLFPPLSAKTSEVNWIARRLSADPTIAVQALSSEAISVSGAPAIRWNGTLNGATTTLVYIFAPKHIFEIALSSLSGQPDSAKCGPRLETFLQHFAIK